MEPPLFLATSYDDLGQVVLITLLTINAPGVIGLLWWAATRRKSFVVSSFAYASMAIGAVVLVFTMVFSGGPSPDLGLVHFVAAIPLIMGLLLHHLMSPPRPRRKAETPPSPEGTKDESQW